jgi:4-aminobutyrate aminotransferase-like enzyme
MTDAPPGRRLPEIVSPPPAARSRELAHRLRAVESRNVTMVTPDFPVFWEEALGSNVLDADGNRYVDLTAGFAVAAVGHRHPRVVEALRRQAGRLVHGMGDVHPPAAKVELLGRLAGLVPHQDPRAVLGVSGSEAVEAALKTAALATGKPGALGFTGAYHGLGYGALSVTDRDHFRDPFREQLNPHVLRAGFPHPFRPPDRPGFPGAGASPEEVAGAALEEVRKMLDGGAGARVGAVVVEPVQGRGGEVVPPRGFLRELAALCRARDVLLVADEIYTGFGRTGRRFACGAEGVVPDLLCVGKGMSGGMPISACVGERELMDAWPSSEGEAVHTSTFLGHPLSCAAALAALDVLEEEGLAERARELGARWRRALEEMAADHEAVGEVRGRGLMIGLDLVADGRSRGPDGELAGRVVVEALRRGWILLAGGPAGNVVSLSPPLTVPWRLLEAATAMLDEALEAATAGG